MTKTKSVPSLALWLSLLMITLPLTIQAQTYSVLYSLGSQGGDPELPSYFGSFAQGRDGNLYGISQGGGTNSSGAIFRLTPDGTMQVIHRFDGTGQLSHPNGGLTLGTDGNLYGVTISGGSTLGGVLFKITAGGNFSI